MNPKEKRKQAVIAHIQYGRTIASLAAEYGVSNATISNWVRQYREECKGNMEEKSKLELMEEIRRLQKNFDEQQKEIDFLKKATALFVITAPFSIYMTEV